MKSPVLKNTLLIFSGLALFFATALCDLPQAYAGDKAETPADAASAQEVRKEVAEATEALQKYAVEQRDEALAKARQYMKKLDARMEQWESELDANRVQMNQAAREKWQASLQTLRKQRNDLAEWYGGMKHSSAGAWEEIKKGFSAAYASVADSLEKAREEFKEKE